jgi:hypothetical protein
MKRLGWILLALTAPAWGARAITVGQLEDMLRSMAQQKKSDTEVAQALKQVELNQELTRSTMNSLVSYVPGPLSTEQIYVLEARSADLIPPETDLPTNSAPDAAGQKAILDKTATYLTQTYEKLPSLTATKTTLRFQDNMEALAASSGLQGGARDVVTGTGFSDPAAYVHFINSTEAQVASLHGAERLPVEKTKTAWGANKMIAIQEPDPSLGTVWREAQVAGTLVWLRWERIYGKPTAVFAFSVPAKKSRLSVNICCFPDVKQTGVANFYTSTTAATLGGGASGGGASGNFQTSTNWHNFKATTPYHGELFVDPDSGIVVRMIVEAEFKPTDVVHRQNLRVDYAPMSIGGRTLVVPAKSYVNTEVVPNGDSGAARYSTRCTLFTSEYKDYALAGAK